MHGISSTRELFLSSIKKINKNNWLEILPVIEDIDIFRDM